ncbi:uncharacterized protein [Nothobranchius furzeri]|uniref:uncharacterized protein isoform X1 n=1 Tax=Nothobranchius furzeri TaxID=105023 RepID=UPI003904825F
MAEEAPMVQAQQQEHLGSAPGKDEADSNPGFPQESSAARLLQQHVIAADRNRCGQQNLFHRSRQQRESATSQEQHVAALTRRFYFLRATPLKRVKFDIFGEGKTGNRTRKLREATEIFRKKNVLPSGCFTFKKGY